MAKKTNRQATGRELHDLFREVFELQATLSGVMDKVHEQAGLSTSQLKIIRALSDLGPTTVPDLAAVFGVTRQFIQTVCNGLQAREFLEFRENPRHKRSKLVALTEPGRIAFQQARQKEEEIIEKSLPAMHPGKAKEACKLLESIRKAVQKKIV
jgi:DNA-binding MarR family transcriptional regulator